MVDHAPRLPVSRCTDALRPAWSTHTRRVSRSSSRFRPRETSLRVRLGPRPAGSAPGALDSGDSEWIRLSTA
eukprot:1275689-Rhodomonas_salina.2